jgi:predicted hydrocarbon binding protein
MGYEDQPKPVCCRMEGILASLFETVFERKAVCSETKCSAVKGDACEFEITCFNMPAKLKRIASKPPKNLETVIYHYYPDRGELEFEGMNLIFFPRGDAKRIEQETEKIIGPSTREILYIIGKDAGVANFKPGLVKKILLRLFFRFLRGKIVAKGADVGTKAGLGIFSWEIDKEKKDESWIKLINSANAAGARISDKPVCYTMCGVAAGSASSMFGKKLDCKEVKCIGKGDPYCLFHLYPTRKH